MAEALLYVSQSCRNRKSVNFVDGTLTCTLERFPYLRHCHNLLSRDDGEEFFGVRGRRGRGIWLPSFVLMRVGIVADPTDHQAWEFVHQTGRLHLHAHHL